MNFVFQSTLKQAICIFLIAALFGLLVNLFHPEKVQLTGKRPSPKFAADTVLAMDLPGVSINENGVNQIEENNSIEEPLLITTAQLMQLKSSNQVQIIDARSKEEYAKSHIAGAENIPYNDLSEYKTKIDSLPKDKWLVCYCNEPSCDQAELLAYELIIAGHEVVAVYFDGLTGWKKAGNEIDGKEAEKNAQ